MRLRDLTIFGGLVLLLCLTRWPLAPPYLFYFDSVNMAYALEHFSPPEHKPQPPGYPLYVGLCRLIHAAGASVESTFIWSAILAGALTGWLLWRFGSDLGRPRAGLFAAGLFTFTPVFWFNSLTNQSRGFSAVASAGAAWLCWRAGQRDAHPCWLIAAAAFVGTLAGFRPVETLMLTPLLLWAIWQGRPALRSILLAAVAGALPVAIWGYALFSASGGFEAYLTMMRNYSMEQRVFEAGMVPDPWRIFSKSVEWVTAMHVTAILPFVWVLVWQPRRSSAGELRHSPLRSHSLFVLVWLLPGLAFQVLGHAADPCHSLATIVGVCWLGGLAVDRMQGQLGWGGLLLACILSAELFFGPLRGAARATSYHVIARVNKDVGIAMDTLGRMQQHGVPTSVIRDSLVTWRHIRYYFPEANIWIESGVQRTSPSGATVFPDTSTANVVVFDRHGARFGWTAATPERH
jgi:hypothetical protein